MPRVDGNIVEFLKIRTGKEFSIEFNWREKDSKLVRTVGLSFRDDKEIEEIIQQSDENDVVRAILTYLVKRSDDKFDETEFGKLEGRTFTITINLEEIK